MRRCWPNALIFAAALSAWLLFHCAAFAQNSNDVMQLFGSLVQQAIRQAALAEWQRIPPEEGSCIDESLRRQGASIDALVSRGILPTDPRLGQVRSACRTPQAASSLEIETLSSKPTFDCGRARSLTARTVCLDRPGAAADWDLISAYWARYFSIPESERPAFEQSQQAWLDSLNQTCPRAPNPQQCVLSAYHKRAADYRTQLDGDALAESRLTPEQHAKIQQSLAAIGYLNETPDGEFGPNTRTAIKLFKLQSGDAEGDFLSSPQRRQLFEGATSGGNQTVAVPSFDCSRATTPDERMICSNHRLAELDNLVASGYEYARAKYGAAEASRIARPLLQSREACGAAMDCIEQSQINAIKMYQSLGASLSLPLTAPPVNPSTPPAQSEADKVRSDYKKDGENYHNLTTYNDRYNGIDSFAAAFADYSRAASDDNIAEMIRRRPAFLKETDVATARKELLTQQSAQIGTYQKTLVDIEASVQHDGLTKLLETDAANNIAELRTNLERLAQTAPAKRGNIAADLDATGKRIRDIDVVVTSARAAKGQIDEIRRKLTEQEAAAKQMLEAATSEQLQPAFNDQFTASIQTLIGRLDTLALLDQQSLREKREDITDALRNVNQFQETLSAARAKYELAQRSDEKRRSEMQKLSAALKDFSRSENHDKLSQKGLLITDQIQAELHDLSQLDGKPLLVRRDYGEVLTAADQTLGEADTLRTEIVDILQLTTDLKSINDRIGKRGQQLLDASTSSRLQDLSVSVRELGAAKIPLSDDERQKLAGARPNLRQLQSTIDDAMDREERRLCEHLIISKGYFVNACIARGMEISRHSDNLAEAEAAAERERNGLKCSADSLNKLREMAIASAARILDAGSITSLMDFSDVIKLECNKEAGSIAQAKHF
jgi:uncharacterized protein